MICKNATLCTGHSTKQVTVHSVLSNIKIILYEKRKKSNCAFEDFML